MDNRNPRPQLTLGDLWDRKQGGELAEDDGVVAFGEIAEQQGIIVQLFTTLGAWLAALMFLGMMAVMGMIHSEESMIFWGALFLAVYVATNRISSIPPKFEPFFLAVGMIGQLLVLFGIADKMEPMALGLIGLAVEGALLFLVKSRIQRFISTVCIFLSLLLLIHAAKAYHATHLLIGICAFALTYIWVHEPKVLARSPLWAQFIAPTGIGISVSLLLILSVTVNRSFYADYTDYWWASTVMIAGSLGYLVWHAMTRYDEQGHIWIALLALGVALAPTVFAPGIAYSFLLLALGFYRGHRIISALGAIALICFTSMFYYNLQISLLIKSGSLAAAGALLLLLRWGIARMAEGRE